MHPAIQAIHETAEQFEIFAVADTTIENIFVNVQDNSSNDNEVIDKIRQMLFSARPIQQLDEILDDPTSSQSFLD